VLIRTFLRGLGTVELDDPSSFLLRFFRWIAKLTR
jgi:hypothetical protein